MTYREFLRSKIMRLPDGGFDVELSDISRKAFVWQRHLIRWALQKGKCALFEECGLGKTLQQLEWSRQVCNHTERDVLILAPLAVSHQTAREGEKFDINVNICDKQSDVMPGINITNYEKLHHFDPSAFVGVVLDESSILKHVGSRIRQTITEAFCNTPYKLACTATPAPNDFMELGNHAEFLGVMTRSEMLASFFVHDGGETQKWRLKGHAEEMFWEWVASWAVVLRNPQDIGFEVEGYDLPPLNIREHIVMADNLEAPDGQTMLLPQSIQNLQERRHARRSSVKERVREAANIANACNEQVLVWCDLNRESEALTRAIDGAVEITGAHSNIQKTASMDGFTNGCVRVLVSKPSIAGWGMNWQNCHNVIFVGLSDSFEAYYQAIRRCWRYGQRKPVNVHIIISEAEGAVSENIKRKHENALRMMKAMVKHTNNIIKCEIHQTRKLGENYYALEPIVLPSFLEGAT